MGIEPTLLAWKARVLPLNYTRNSVGTINFTLIYCFCQYLFLILFYILAVCAVIPYISVRLRGIKQHSDKVSYKEKPIRAIDYKEKEQILKFCKDNNIPCYYVYSSRDTYQIKMTYCSKVST